MMQFNISEMICLCFDYGMYINVAEKLSEKFGKVYYFNPNVHDGFQTKTDVTIATGINGVIKVNEWASVIEEVHFVFFTFCYEPALQEYFRSIGKLVFGSGQSAILETNRVYGKEVLKEMGLPVGPSEVAFGLEDLEMRLMDKENVFVKSDHRGDHETIKWKKWILSKGQIRRAKRDMGVLGDDEVYVIEDEIPSIGEVGSDTFCVNGDYPSIVSVGCESKDACYVCRFMPYAQVPKQIKTAMEGMGRKFSELGYNGWISNEIIIGKDLKGYWLDTTARMPSPVSNIVLNNISNFAECALNVASGIVPEIDYKFEYCVELIIKSDVAEHDDTPLIVPIEYQPYVCIYNLMVDEDGTWYFSKRGLKTKEIGSIMGMGKTLKEARAMAQRIWDSIESEDARVDFDALDAATEQLNTLSRHGVKIL